MNTHEIITTKVIEAIEKGGVLPWKKPWKQYAGASSFPKNLVSKRDYSGINSFLLSMNPFSSPYWLTYKQAVGLGGHVKKGEKGSPIIFWSKITVEDKGTKKDEVTKKEKHILLFKYFTVFNTEQCEGIKVPSLQELKLTDFEKIERCEKVVNEFQNKPTISHDKPEAYYSFTEDLVNMPIPQVFKNSEEYYCTLFHELAHSTGHEKRLNRKAGISSVRFGDASYSKEELVAELTSSFLCAETGIENATFDNSVAYIEGWLRVLKSSPKLLMEAGAQAQKAANYILNKNNNNQETD